MHIPAQQDCGWDSTLHFLEASWYQGSHWISRLLICSYLQNWAECPGKLAGEEHMYVYVWVCMCTPDTLTYSFILASKPIPTGSQLDRASYQGSLQRCVPGPVLGVDRELHCSWGEFFFMGITLSFSEYKNDVKNLPNHNFSSECIPALER